MALNDSWEKRKKQVSNGHKIRDRGAALAKQYTDILVERRTTDSTDLLSKVEDEFILVEANKCYADGAKMIAEAELEWLNAVHKAYGNVTIMWLDENKICKLGNGEVYN